MTKEIGDNTLLDTWAKDGAIQEPNLSKIAVGWLSGERPAFQWFNWIINGVQKKINYILKRGITDWHEETEYDAGDIVNRNGLIFIAVVSNVGEPPPNILFWREPGPLDNLVANTDPTSSNDITEGYSVGSKWYNQASKEAFLCFDNTEGAAIWEHATLDSTDLGTAALKNTGSEPGEVPLNSDLGDLAGKNQISIDDIDTTGQPAGKYLTTAGDGSAIYTDPPVNANQLAKAWVNFNGTGTVAIRSSYNVSSITDNGTGNYTINFATPMSNANYAWGVSGLTNASSSSAGVNGDVTNPPTANNVTVKSYFAGSNQDFPYVSLIVFGG